MDNINCKVAEDLLPLYLDGLLSDETKLIVEEHIRTCEKCGKLYDDMRENYRKDASGGDTAGMNAIRNIRRKIRIGRLISILASVILVLGICMGIGYGVFFKEKYIPYDDSGIYVANGYLKTARNYNRLYGFRLEGDEAEYIYLASTAYTDMSERDKVIEIYTLAPEDRTDIKIDENGKTTETVRAVYYVPEEYAEKLSRIFRTTDKEDGSAQETAALTEELKNVSVLIWSES